MSYPKLRDVSSNSIIDISPLQPSKPLPYSPSSSKSSCNQNRAQPQPRTSSYIFNHQLCHSHSNDSLDEEFLHQTKQTFNQLFHQTNFHQLLDQIQCTLQPITDQLREQIQRKKDLSKHDRFICLKSCAKFITESLLNDQRNIDVHLPEFYQLQNVLNRLLFKERKNSSTQTSDELEIDLTQLQIGDNLKTSSQKLRRTPRVSFISTDELTRQKNYHRSVSRAFRKLNADLQKMNHETPFQAHLSKYHKHNH